MFQFNVYEIVMFHRFKILKIKVLSKKINFPNKYCMIEKVYFSDCETLF